MIGGVGDVIRGLSLLRPDAGTRLAAKVLGTNAVELTASAADGLPGMRVEVELGDAVGYWHPEQRAMRALSPDWAGRTTTSLVRSAPVGALYTATGEVLLGWAAGEGVAELSVRFGVSEEHKSFVVELRPVRPLGADLTVVLDGARDSLAETVRRLGTWLSDRCAGPVREPPALARLPVYSTWYAFHQDIDAARVTAEAALAVELGCGSVFIDDGWQRLGRGRSYRGNGDWVPDEAKFGDLAATVETIHGMGAAAALWVAPLLLGPQSAAFGRLAAYAPHAAPGLDRSQVLDPRYGEVRAHAVESCLRLVRDYGVDLLKLDFLDHAMVYRDAPGGGDLPDVGLAVAELLGGLLRRLAEMGRGDVAFEFRQPYVSPAVARFGEILRANDCPADSVINRRGTIDARLLSVGQVVHSDSLMWGPTGGAEAVAQQLYGGWFAVPQISMCLSALPREQVSALRGLLDLWREHVDVVLGGTLTTSGAEHGYDVVGAVRADLGRSVIARYVPTVVDLGAQQAAATTVINATPVAKLVLRVARPVSGGVVRSAAADEIATVAPMGVGLVELAVPPYGSVTLTA